MSRRPIDKSLESKILKLYAAGMTMSAIARETGVAKATVSRRVRDAEASKNLDLEGKKLNLGAAIQQWDEVTENVLLTHAPERYGYKIYGGLLDEWDILHERYGRRRT